MFIFCYFKEVMNNFILYNNILMCRKKDCGIDIRCGIKVIVVYIFYR